MVTLLTESGEHEVAGTEPSTEALWVSAQRRAPGHRLGGEARRALQGPGLRAVARGARARVRGRRPDQPGRASGVISASPRSGASAATPGCSSESAKERKAALTSLEAPDFALPDPSGRMHRLSDYRGKKVFLVTWASW